MKYDPLASERIKILTSSIPGSQWGTRVVCVRDREYCKHFSLRAPYPCFLLPPSRKSWRRVALQGFLAFAQGGKREKILGNRDRIQSSLLSWQKMLLKALGNFAKARSICGGHRAKIEVSNAPRMIPSQTLQ